MLDAENRIVDEKHVIHADGEDQEGDYFQANHVELYAEEARDAEAHEDAAKHKHEPEEREKDVGLGQVGDLTQIADYIEEIPITKMFCFVSCLISSCSDF